MKYSTINSAFFAKGFAASTALAVFIAVTPFSYADPTINFTAIAPAKTTPPADKPYISPGITYSYGGEGTIAADATDYTCDIKYTIAKDNAPNSLPVVKSGTAFVSAHQTASLNRSWDVSIQDLGDYTGLFFVKAYAVNGPVVSPNPYSSGINTSFVIGYKNIGIPGG